MPLSRCQEEISLKEQWEGGISEEMLDQRGLFHMHTDEEAPWVLEDKRRMLYHRHKLDGSNIIPCVYSSKLIPLKWVPEKHMASLPSMIRLGKPILLSLLAICI